MALDDFSSTGHSEGTTHSAASPEADDLFDFPAVEMMVDLPKTTAQAPTAIAAAAPQAADADEDLFGFPPIEITLESLEREAAKDLAQKPLAAPPKKPAPQPPAPTPAVRVPAPQVATQVAPAVATHAPAPVTPSPAPAARPHTPAARPQPAAPERQPQVQPAAAQTQPQPVTRAAELIDDIETAMGAEIESGGVRRRKRSLVTAPAIWLVVGAGLALNAGAFFLLWQSNRSFRHGIEGLRDELVVMVREVRLGANETRAALPAALASEPAAHTPTETPKLQSAPPIEPFEKTTLTLAEEEIRTGEFAAARRRLYRLLAMADRIDAGLREHVEMRANYMLADSYRLQAQARREGTP